MAGEATATKEAKGTGIGSDVMAKARAARAARTKNEATLNDKQKFVRDVARNAIKAAKLVIQRIERGDDISADVVEACSNLAGKTGALFLAE